MNKVFVEHIENMMEIYIDDMLVKTIEDSNLLFDLETFFNYLHRKNMRLNPQKCAFTIEAGKFLDFMLTHQGIKVNPRQVLSNHGNKKPDLHQGYTVHDRKNCIPIQLPSNVSSKSAPSFSLLRKESIFEWTPKCKEAFQDFKKYVSSPPILSKLNLVQPL